MGREGRRWRWDGRHGNLSELARRGLFMIVADDADGPIHDRMRHT